MDTAEIASLLAPYARLDESQLANTLTYNNVLSRWNARMNLTAVREPREMVQRHFGESFFAASRLLAGQGQLSVIDVGSGAGFPGIPIALWSTEARVTLIESNARKATFLKEVLRELQLKNAKVFHGRAERYSETAELVTMRAVENFEKAVSVAAALVSQSGCLALMLGTRQVEEAERSAPGFDWQHPVPVPGGHSRVLLAGTRRVTGGISIQD